MNSSASVRVWEALEMMLAEAGCLLLALGVVRVNARFVAAEDSVIMTLSLAHDG
jgi:hypothetical protein